jgi:RNA polymerase sigma factor (sigma-70 family)
VPDEEPAWWTSINLEMVHHAIKDLPEGCRQVFVLYVLEDFSHKDIAKRLGISESTSKSQYQRARKLLKDKLLKKII